MWAVVTPVQQNTHIGKHCFQLIKKRLNYTILLPWGYTQGKPLLMLTFRAMCVKHISVSNTNGYIILNSLQFKGNMVTGKN